MGFKEKEVRLDSFVYSKLHYCPLVWHFCSSKPLYKTKKKLKKTGNLFTTLRLR